MEASIFLFLLFCPEWLLNLQDETISYERLWGWWLTLSKNPQTFGKGKKKHLLWNLGFKNVFLFAVLEFLWCGGASLVWLRHIRNLCDLGGALESSLISNQVCLSFSSSVIHLNAQLWPEETILFISMASQICGLGQALTPQSQERQARVPQVPGDDFEDTQKEETYHH